MHWDAQATALLIPARRTELATEDMENAMDPCCVQTLKVNPFLFYAAFLSSRYTPILIPTLLAPLMFLYNNKSITCAFIPQ